MTSSTSRGSASYRGEQAVRRNGSRERARANALAAGLLTVVLCLANGVSAQQADGGSAEVGGAIDGSPPPVAPATITRDSLGRPTVRAIRLDEPLVLDGNLDEAIYSDHPPFGDFIQLVPVADAPSSERSDVWLSYDDANVYVTCRCWDSSPPEEWVVNELRRDAVGLRNNEHFGVMFDTFYDRRSGFMFYANELGARTDYAVVDEVRANLDWNPVWDVAGGRFEGGWIVEMAIPFKSLRYLSGSGRLWGLQLRRSIRHKNEWAYLSPVPPSMAGSQGLTRISSAGTIVGLELPPAGNNLEVKPYAISDLTTNRLSDPATRNVVDADVGIDLKYGIMANLTADVTLNTDFAQVEVDEQQVNLTRFSLFFPEKRDFFLEGRGTLDFGQGRAVGFRGGGVGPGVPGSERRSDALLFETDRIGPRRGHPDPSRGPRDRQGGWLRGRSYEHPDRRQRPSRRRRDELLRCPGEA